MFRAEKDTTRSATQVCRRRVESGLGGHDDGVCGVDEGLWNTSLSSRKRRRAACSDCAPSVIMAAPTMKSSRKTKKQLQDDDMNCSDTCHCPHLSSHQHASVNKIIKHVTFSVLFVFYSSDDLKLVWLCKEHIVVNHISSCGFAFHCNFHHWLL